MAAGNLDYIQFTQNICDGFEERVRAIFNAYSMDIVGSAAECLMFLHEDSDLDVMITEPNVVALSNDIGPICMSSTPDDQVHVLKFSTYGVHSGYAKILLDYGQELTHLEVDAELYDPDSGFTRHGPALTMHKFSPLMPSFTLDAVVAIKCLLLPVEASEWVTRTRQHGWPSQDLINNIVQQGCHLVPVSPKHSTNPDIEWRFSFSKAEIQLIHSWSNTQKEVYKQLRLVVSTINKQFNKDDRILCSYHMKTLMLWACEEKPVEFWAQDKVDRAIQQLLSEMVECLLVKRLPSYFIRDNNLLDMGTEINLTDFEKLTETLLYLAESDVSLIDVIHSSEFEKLTDLIEDVGTLITASEPDHASLPLGFVFISLKFKRFIASLLQNTDTKITCCDAEFDWSNGMLECDLCDLYCGLRAQLQSHELTGQERKKLSRCR